MVQHAWGSVRNLACPFERLDAKFWVTCQGLQAWSQNRVGNFGAQLQQVQEMLLRLEIAQDRRPLSLEEDWLRRRLKHHSLALASLHRTIIRAGSRIDWLAERDANMNFFHIHARYWKWKNTILKLQEGDRILTSEEEMEEAIWEFYNSLLCTAE